MVILDTDHVSLFQRNQPEVVTHVLNTPPNELATTVITLEEQLRGRLDRIRQARGAEQIVRAYQNLLSTVKYFQTIQIIPFDATAVTKFQSLRAQKIRIGTQDLKIAAIALSRDIPLITRNYRDFEKIPHLQIEDWS